jgi:flagellar biosynthetic protein FlhB
VTGEDRESKTEAPSAKRLAEAQAKGQFARAPEITLAFVLTAAVFALGLAAHDAARRISHLATETFVRLGEVKLQSQELPDTVWLSASTFATIVGPVILVSAAAAILAGGIQSGFQLTPGAMEPNLGRLNPVAGLQRLISGRIWSTAVLDVLKVTAVFACLAAAGSTIFSDAIFSAPVEPLYLGYFLRESALSLMLRFLGALVIIGGLSYAYEFYKARRELMMSRQDLKDERSQTDGNPLVKAAMRRMARRLLQKQMMDAVPTADVVVANPTHFAVALRYDRGKDAAPVIVARGENRQAIRIKELAALHGVPMVENRPVARMLYASGRVGEVIPREMFEAVAEILAFVYRTYRYYYFTLPTRRAANAFL